MSCFGSRTCWSKSSKKIHRWSCIVLHVKAKAAVLVNHKSQELQTSPCWREIRVSKPKHVRLKTSGWLFASMQTGSLIAARLTGIILQTHTVQDFQAGTLCWYCQWICIHACPVHLHSAQVWCRITRHSRIFKYLEHQVGPRSILRLKKWVSFLFPSRIALGQRLQCLSWWLCISLCTKKSTIIFHNINRVVYYRMSVFLEFPQFVAHQYTEWLVNRLWKICMLSSKELDLNSRHSILFLQPLYTTWTCPALFYHAALLHICTHLHHQVVDLIMRFLQSFKIRR